MGARNRETILNGVCLGICVFIGALTSFGLLGFDPGVTYDTKQTCKNHEHLGSSCKSR